ncbi:MAG: hypothetical protein AAF226_07665 [Verrucomicrobiota bacterium]
MKYPSPNNLCRIYIPYDSKIGSRDRYGVWSLSDDDACYVAYLADAPTAAKLDTGRVIDRWFQKQLSEWRKYEDWDQCDRDQGESHLLQWLQKLNQYLIELSEAKPTFYAAITIALRTRSFCHLISIGDTAAYLGQAHGLYRHSGSTELPSGSTVTNKFLDHLPREAPHLREADYLGADLNIAERFRLESIEAGGPNLLLLISDGIETQIGIPRLCRLLFAYQNSDSLQSQLLAACSNSEPLDDLAALGIETK